MTVARWIAGLIAITALVFVVPQAWAQTTAQAAISWTDAPDEDSYRIERSDDGAAAVAIGTVGQNVTSFTDDGGGVGLNLGVQYCYTIISVAIGEAASSPACGTPSAPSAPTQIQIQFSEFPG